MAMDLSSLTEIGSNNSSGVILAPYYEVIIVELIVLFQLFSFQ